MCNKDIGEQEKCMSMPLFKQINVTGNLGHPEKFLKFCLVLDFIQILLLVFLCSYVYMISFYMFELNIFTI